MQSPISPSSTLPLTSTPTFTVTRYSSLHPLIATLHFLLTFLSLLISLPFHLVTHYILFRSHSPSIQIGRHPVAFVVHRLIRWSFGESYLESTRWIYTIQPFPSLWRDEWIEGVEMESGVKGVWIRNPGTERREDELVLYWIHGGAFTYNTINSTLLFYRTLCSELNRSTPSHPSSQFSMFLLDYPLAPSHPYPTQLISLESGYRYLTQELGIRADHVCLGGDSAGGTLVISFLLHLARSNPLLPSPIDLEKPGSTLLISPFVSLLPLSSRPSRSSPLHNTIDYIHSTNLTQNSYHYLSLIHHSALKPSWNPLNWFGIISNPILEGVRVRELEEGKWRDPFVNPDPEVLGKENSIWYREAFPEGENCCIAYGGMEIFRDDISSLLDALRTVGVNPVTIYEPLKTHDWPIFDFMLPFASRIKGGGEASKSDYGSKKVAEFLRDVARGGQVREKGNVSVEGQKE